MLHSRTIEYFTRTIHSLKMSIRTIYSFYSKFMLIHLNKVKIPLNKNFFPPDYPDLYNLFRLTMKIKPKVSLEVGSGYSTLVFAEALSRISEKETEDERRIHYSLEQDEKYLRLIKDYLDLDHFKYVRFIETDLIVKEVANQKVSICRNFPDLSINLFYEDENRSLNFLNFMNSIPNLFISKIVAPFPSC